MKISAFIQARMSSSRYPGKMLAPMLGQPVVRHVLERAAKAVGASNVVLCTSTDASDDPLDVYTRSLGYSVYRGSLENTVHRFQETAREHPCDAFFRVCGDSPLLDPELVLTAVPLLADGVDLVTNVQPRSYPKGHSVELVRTTSYLKIPADALTDAEREHATRYLYENVHQLTIVNMSAAEDHSRHEGYALDTFEDLKRLEAEVRMKGFPRALKPARTEVVAR